MSAEPPAPAKSPANAYGSETHASRSHGPKTDGGPNPRIGKAILAFLIADLLLWATELVPALVLGAEPQKFDMVMLLTPLIIIPWLTGAPALLGLGLHALIGGPLSRPLLLLALLALCIWWGVTNGQTFLAPRLRHRQPPARRLRHSGARTVRSVHARVAGGTGGCVGGGLCGVVGAAEIGQELVARLISSSSGVVSCED